MTKPTMKLKVVLTGRAPVKIDEAQWEEIGRGSRYAFDNQYDFQANRIWDDIIRVRQHADGRALVYGRSEYTSQYQGESGYQYKAGKLVESGGDICAAIYSVASDLKGLGAPNDVMNMIAAECIASLPAEEI